jgi:hypothetical protein
MSTEEDKLKHSKRIHADKTAIKKQMKIAKSYGIEVKEPHKLAKHHVLDCGRPGCIMCGNPRKVWKKETIQEKRFKQVEVELE